MLLLSHTSRAVILSNAEISPWFYRDYFRFTYDQVIKTNRSCNFYGPYLCPFGRLYTLYVVIFVLVECLMQSFGRKGKLNSTPVHGEFHFLPI